MREYPPILTGPVENQVAQLRAYLIRLNNYIDEMTGEAGAKTKADDATEAQQHTYRRIPTAVSDLVNDLGFITEESDPTVPAWAKADSKPTYTYSEVGAVPDTHDILPRPEEDIPENGDLNDYWDSGVRRIMDANIAATVDNVPYTGSGAKVITMTTSAGGDGRYSVQIYIANGADILIWIRYKAAADATPGAWKRVTMQGEITASTLSALQYVSQSLTSAQENQVLTNLGLTSDLKAAASVAAGTFFTTNPLSSATYDIRKSGKVVSFYAYFSSAPTNGTIRSGYRPCGGTSGRYMILPLLSKSSPYTPVGSVWINGSGAMTFYGASNGGYVSGSWVCT